MDKIRLDDLNQMRLMAKELGKLRKEDKIKKSQTSRALKEKEKEKTERPASGNLNTTNYQIRNRMQ